MSSSQQQNHHSSLTRIPLIVRVLSFASTSVLDPVKFASTTSSWDESVRHYSAVSHVWKNLIRLAKKARGHWLDKMKADREIEKSKRNNIPTHLESMLNHFIHLAHDEDDLSPGVWAREREDEWISHEPFALKRIWRDYLETYQDARENPAFKQIVDLYFREEVIREEINTVLQFIASTKNTPDLLGWYFKKALESGSFTLHGLRLALDYAIDADNAEMAELVMDRMIAKKQKGDNLFKMFTSLGVREKAEVPKIANRFLYFDQEEDFDDIDDDDSRAVLQLPLIRAIFFSRTAVATLFLRKYSPLYFDANQTTANVVETTINGHQSSSNDNNTATKPIDSPLRQAIKSGNLEVVKVFFEEGSRLKLALDTDLASSLFLLAVQSNAVSIVEYMLRQLPSQSYYSSGAMDFLTCRDPEMRLRAINAAAVRHRFEMLQLLLIDHHLDQSHVLNVSSRPILNTTKYPTPFHMILWIMHKRMSQEEVANAHQCCQALVDAGFPIDVTTLSDNKSALASAIVKGSPHAAQIFLELGANLDWVDSNDPGVNLAELARRNNQFEMFQSIFEK